MAFGLTMFVLLSCIVLLSLGGYDFTTQPKAASMGILKTLSSLQESAVGCRNASEPTETCIQVRDRLSKLNSSNSRFFLTSRGALIGVDFSNRVLVLLEPSAIESESRWTCTVTPAQAAPAACVGLK